MQKKIKHKEQEVGWKTSLVNLIIYKPLKNKQQKHPTSELLSRLFPCEVLSPGHPLANVERGQYNAL